MMRFPAGQDPGAGTQVDHIAPSQSFGPEGDHFSAPLIAVTDGAL